MSYGSSSTQQSPGGVRKSWEPGILDATFPWDLDIVARSSPAFPLEKWDQEGLTDGHSSCQCLLNIFRVECWDGISFGFNSGLGD